MVEERLLSRLVDQTETGWQEPLIWTEALGKDELLQMPGPVVGCVAGIMGRMAKEKNQKAKLRRPKRATKIIIN